MLVGQGSNLLEAARLVGLRITSICGGHGRCGRCRVIVDKKGKNAGPVTEVEEFHLLREELSAGYRLACRAIVEGDLTVKIPEESRSATQRLQAEGVETLVKPEPSVKKYYIELQKPTLEDHSSDVDRLLNELASRYNLKDLEVRYDVLKNLPQTLRASDWKVTAVVWDGKEIIGLEPDDTVRRNFGYAVDIGTTKLAGYLVDIHTGEVVAAKSLVNPQVTYGDDVLTRISYATRGDEELDRLQQLVVSAANQILLENCQTSGISPREVYEMTVVGNTAMHHIFLKLPPKDLALSPYTPVVRNGLDIEAEKIGVKMNPKGNVHVLPVIAGFVGADAVSVILATGAHRRREFCLTLDIGTNTEVILGGEDRILACSCASGPAFEGARIKHGTRAESGAIEKTKIDPETLEVHYQTVDEVDPCGICGSAMVDILAEMLKAGIIDVAGRINTKVDSSRLRVGEAGQEFVLVDGEETSIGRDIVVTQRDIRELQLAKAAIHTGIEILLRKRGITERHIEFLFIAGALGSHVDPESAGIIGLYPEINTERVNIVGNAAGTGARMALLSRKVRKEAERVSKRVQYVELAAEPGFRTEFLNSQYIPHADLSKYPETSKLLKRLGRYPEKPIPVLKKSSDDA